MSTLVKMPHCCKSHVTAYIVLLSLKIDSVLENMSQSQTNTRQRDGEEETQNADCLT